MEISAREIGMYLFVAGGVLFVWSLAEFLHDILFVPFPRITNDFEWRKLFIASYPRTMRFLAKFLAACVLFAISAFLLFSGLTQLILWNISCFFGAGALANIIAAVLTKRKMKKIDKELP